MNGNGSRALAAIAVCTLWSTAAAARDLPSEVRAVFAAKCAACHGPDLPKPKGRFGYVLDLARVAGNREMVVPFMPDESELWELVRRGEMPPDDSPPGPLTAEQKETIRAWIAAGGPAGLSTGTTAESLAEPPENESSVAAATSPALKHLLGRIGRFHILIVHFPIGLLIAAVAAELWSARRGDRAPAPTVRFCIGFGAAGAVVAAVLGWFHAGTGFGATTPQVLALHAWSGTMAATWAVGTACFSEWESRRGLRSHWFRAWLIAGATLVAIASHFGGALVHGADFLTPG